MRRYKSFNGYLFLIVCFGISLSLMGCSSTEEKRESLEVVDAPQTESATLPESEVTQDLGVLRATGEAAPEEVASGDGSQKQLRVWFVKDKTAIIREAPNDEAKKVGQLSRGEHVLVHVNGEWGEISEKRYIKVDHLSETPISRNKSKNKWQLTH